MACAREAAGGSSGWPGGPASKTGHRPTRHTRRSAKATLLAPKKRVAWLDQAAADARKQLEEADLAGSGAEPGEVR